MNNLAFIVVIVACLALNATAAEPASPTFLGGILTCGSQRPGDSDVTRIQTMRVDGTMLTEIDQLRGGVGGAEARSRHQRVKRF